MGYKKLKTEEILNEREKTHGDFEDVAFVHDGMMDCLNHSSNVLSCAKRLAISNICLKLARIVCGDPNFADHWDDIAGYAMLGKGQKPDKDAMKKWQEMMAEKEGCFICNKNIDKPHHVLDWVNFVCDKCLKEGSENFDRIMKEAEIRQEDMPATAKAGQKFKYEGGEFVPLEGWAYCKECDGSTQHEDGFCMRESCQQKENPKCSDCGKVLYAASVVKLPCMGKEKFLCFRCAGLTFKECAEEKNNVDDEWWDAETCLPIPGRWVAVQCKDTFGQIEEIDYAQLNIIDDRYYWGESFYSDLYNDDGLISLENKVLKWKYADEN